MALVQHIERTRKDRQEVHRPTRCLASGFTSGTQRFIQLDTYGSDAREFSGEGEPIAPVRRGGGAAAPGAYRRDVSFAERQTVVERMPLGGGKRARSAGSAYRIPGMARRSQG